MIGFSQESASGWIRSYEIDQLKPQIESAHELLHSGKGPGSAFTGWMKLPDSLDIHELERIHRAADRIRAQSDILIVIGIGGSYLGARAAIDMLTPTFSDLLPREKRSAPHIVFAGNHLSADYLYDLLETIKGQRISVNVISKSGTTTEPAIAFRILKQWMEEQYGREEAQRRIYVTTDKSRGALRKLAVQEQYETFVVPDDVGGRYSVLTPVGLLPIAVAGIDIDAMLDGARDGMHHWQNPDPDDNPCYRYAACRNVLLRKGYQIEVMVQYEPSMQYLTEWWKQLFGESEGKDGRGLFPAGVANTTDLHSMGQYIQDGQRILFETVLSVEESKHTIVVPADDDNGDGLNYLAERSLHEINEQAARGTILAHVAGGVPNLRLTVPERTPYWFGQLVCFFELACAISGYLLAVNPFDQPGVEAYKDNMYALLGKPGYEQKKAELEALLAERDS